MKKLLFTTSLVLFLGSMAWAQRSPHDFGALLESVNPFAHNAGFLGVVLEDLSEDRKAELGLDSLHGALIRNVAAASAAEEAGVQTDDVIILWDGVAVRSAAQMHRLVKETPPGRSVDFSVLRGGKEMALNCVPQERNIGGFSMRDLGAFAQGEEEDDVPEMLLKPSGPKLGVVVLPLDPQLAAYFGVAEHGGILVSSVQEGSVAGEAGIQAGDVLVSINGGTLHSAADVTRLLVQHAGEELSLRYIRDKKIRDVKLDL